MPRLSVRLRLKPDNSNSHGFELHRPSNQGTKLLLKVIKAIIIIVYRFGAFRIPPEKRPKRAKAKGARFEFWYRAC